MNERAAAARGTTSDQRGDALVLIHLPADRKSVYGISIMRDLWVDIPGHGTAKVNAALELGGLPLMTRTVEALLGAHIDHTVMLDFQGFAAMTDALGGVDVNIKQSFTATADDKVHFPAGVNHLNGLQALAFVRERHAFADGDYQRVRNQQTFLKAMMAKLASEGGLADRGTVRKLIKTVLPHVTLDASFTLESLENLAFSLRSTPPGRGVFFTLPTAGTGFSRDGQSIVLKDPAATAALSAALRSGTLAELRGGQQSAERQLRRRSSVDWVHDPDSRPAVPAASRRPESSLGAHPSRRRVRGQLRVAAGQGIRRGRGPAQGGKRLPGGRDRAPGAAARGHLPGNQGPHPGN